MGRKQFLVVVCVAILGSVAAGTAGRSDESIIGYSADAAKSQRALEGRIVATVEAASARSYLQVLSHELNMAGTPGDRRNADYVRSELAKLGFEARLVPYHVYLPWPKKSEITIEGSDPVVIRPGEKGIAADPFTQQPHEFPPFSAFSPSGKVSGEVVFVNFGTPEDYDTLATLGVDVRGKIVLCRYGRLFRGSKAWEAEKRGAAAMILYSDPADDGFFRGDVYPKGPMRPGDAIQRGSIYYMFATPGDPLTPMEPAHKEAKRIDPAGAGLPKIPTMPIGYDDAARILSRIGGASVPQSWQGALPFRYHVGPGPVRLTVDIEVEYAVREIWDVMGILRGTTEPDAWVIVGAHRDSWVRGAQDPHSGGAVMLEAARALATAAKESGGLRRSIVVCSWDAEEFGVIGSVEWVEDFRDELAQKAVLYMNADAIISGRSFGASATPTLRPAFRQVLAEVSGPDNVALLDSWREQRRRSGQQVGDFSFGSFGGGSDHIGFLLHLGIPCVSAGFGGPSGIYHSVYDSFHWMENFGDPGLLSHAAGARLMGVLLVRVANAEVIPYMPSEYAADLRDWIATLAKHDAPTAAALAPLTPIVDSIEEIGRDYEDRLDRALAEGKLDTAARARLNTILIALERSFTDAAGIEGRAWNRNLLYATALDNGYGQEIFPGLRGALNSPERLAREVERLRAALIRYRNGVSGALHLVLDS